MRVDLHLHTWVSDGDISPAEVVRLARQARLDVIAITDHDTAAGVGEALDESAGDGIRVLPGIEISTRWDDQELHVLGYWIDPWADAILEHQRSATERRSIRMEAMVARLQAMGIGITFADVETAAGPSVRTLGRPHLARALHTRGYTRFYGEAFIRYIGDAGPAFVAEGFPLPHDAIRIIHAAGGVAVLAHPPLQWIPDAVRSLAELGLDGLECYRPGLDPSDVAMLERLARAHGLLTTGGSDWHGPRRTVLGDFAVPAEKVEDLLAAGSGWGRKQDGG